MAEKAEAVGRLPLPGADVAAGPFAGLPRPELERTAEALLAGVVALTLLLTQGRETVGDGLRPAGMKKGRRPAA
jgi:hypothetical protein